MAAISERHGLPTGELAPFATGSAVVWGGAEHVVKLAPPDWAVDLETERRVLEHLDGKCRLATPGVLAHGELSGWPYLVMRRLEGMAIGARAIGSSQGYI